MALANPSTILACRAQLHLAVFRYGRAHHATFDQLTDLEAA
jgi:hypothetical protein